MRNGKRDMRKIVTIAGTTALLALTAGLSTAQAETWCRQANGSSMCAFSSYQQCASVVRTAGGTCTRSGFRAETRRTSRYASYSSTPLPVNLHPSRFDCSN